MTRAGDWTGAEPGGLAQGLRDSYPLQGRHVCPFCGSINETMEGPCPHCTMSNTADTRKATKSRIGPWYVLQSRNPAAPGMRYDTLLGFVRKGRVKARSIVRGPTTHQLWRFACQVKGLSREFGVCYSCGGSIERDAQLCPQCNRLQDPPTNPDMFIEGRAEALPEPGTRPETQPTPEPLEMPGAAAAAAVVGGTQDLRRSPIFKDLNVPPAPAPAAPTPMDNGEAFFNRPAAAMPPAAEPGFAPAPSPVQPAMPPPAAAPRGAQKRNAGDVFLSAKDLAAAFQLGFDGKTDDTADPSFDPAAPWAAGDEPPVPSLRPVHPPRRRKRRKGRILLLLLLLAAGAFGAYMAVDAAFRERVVTWTRGQYAKLTGADLYSDLSGGGANPSPAGLATAPSDDGRGPGGEAAIVPPPATTRAAVPEGPPPTPPQSQPVAREIVRRDVPAPAPRQPPKTQPVVATRPVAATQPALTHEQAVKKSRELYIQALDAEERGDYRKAKAVYEQIMKTLPQDVWYQGIETRLRIAKEMLGEK